MKHYFAVPVKGLEWRRSNIHLRSSPFPPSFTLSLKKLKFPPISFFIGLFWSDDRSTLSVVVALTIGGTGLANFSDFIAVTGFLGISFLFFMTPLDKFIL
jgi:hypothetical protein